MWVEGPSVHSLVLGSSTPYRSSLLRGGKERRSGGKERRRGGGGEVRRRRTLAAGEEVTRPEVLGVDDVADALHPSRRSRAFRSTRQAVDLPGEERRRGGI